MAKEQDFIDKLTNFTSALEDLVTLLKEQQKIGPTEVVNQLLENLDAEAISNLAKNIEEVKENTVEINKNTEKILKAIKDQKKQKETGMFGDVSDKKNKDKIIDGVKTIILIASGVLAIGMAFKIVGAVDFLSVVALGMGIMFVAMAFAKVAVLKDDKGKPLGWKQLVMGAAVLVLMSGAILVSGLILKQIPILNIKELITIVFVGATMGLATFLIMKGIDKVSFKDMAKAALVPLLLPAIALGIVGAGYALQYMPEVTFKQALSALMVSVAMLPIVLGIGYMIKGLKNASMKDVMFAGLAIPIIAAGIVAASYILQFVQPVPFFDVLLAGIAIGIATLAMVPTIMLLNEVGLTKPEKIKDLAIGVLAITLISMAIVAASWILSFGNYGAYPDAGWSFGVGLSLILFTMPVAFIGILVSSGVGYLALTAGLLGIPLIATAIVLTSWIVGAGNYSTYPPPDWALGVGLSMLIFGTPMIVLGAFIFGTFGFGLAMLSAGIAGILLIAEAIVEADKILSKGKWGNYPSPDWALGVGESIRAFSEVLIELTKLQMLSSMISFFFGGSVEIDLPSFIIEVSNALLTAGKIFNSAPNVFGGNYPTEDWAKGVGQSIKSFSEVLIELTKLQMLSDMISFFSLGLAGGGEIDLKAFIISTSEALIESGRIFSNNKNVSFDGNYPSEDWAKGVGGSIASFAQAIASLKESGVDIDASDLNDDDGAIAIMKGLSYGLIEVGRIFTGNNIIFDDSKVPSPDWAEGVGGSLKAFAEAIASLKEAGVDIDASDLNDDDGAIAIMKGLSEGLIEVGKIFTGDIIFDDSKVPSPDWAEGIVAALNAFASVDGDFDSIFNVKSLIEIMLQTAEFFNEMNSINLPNKEWVSSFIDLIKNGAYEITKVGIVLGTIDDFWLAMDRIINVAKTMYHFTEWMSDTYEEFGSVFEGEGIASKISKSLQTLIEVIPTQEKIDPLWSLIDALQELSEISWFDLSGISDVANAIDYLADKISDIDAGNIDAINRLNAGLHIMSLVDETKLKSVLSAIEDKSETLSEIMDDGGFVSQLFNELSNTIGGKTSSFSAMNTEYGGAIVKKPEESAKSFEDELLKYIKNIDNNISKMAGFTEEEKQEKLESKNVEGND
ncbi:MAG: hypothetical protein HPY57_13435 [Ignavibacteria bacterium]|nr:hypothetical protein [Ignavibacteria bacterium]